MAQIAFYQISGKHSIIYLILAWNKALIAQIHAFFERLTPFRNIEFYSVFLQKGQLLWHYLLQIMLISSIIVHDMLHFMRILVNIAHMMPNFQAQMLQLLKFQAHML